MRHVHCEVEKPRRIESIRHGKFWWCCGFAQSAKGETSMTTQSTTEMLHSSVSHFRFLFSAEAQIRIGDRSEHKTEYGTNYYLDMNGNAPERTFSYLLVNVSNTTNEFNDLVIIILYIIIIIFQSFFIINIVGCQPAMHQDLYTFILYEILLCINI